jgi:hypothetical protein
MPELRDEAEGHKVLAGSVYLFALLIIVPIFGVCSQPQRLTRPESSASSTTEGAQRRKPPAVRSTRGLGGF